MNYQLVMEKCGVIDSTKSGDFDKIDETVRTIRAFAQRYPVTLIDANPFLAP